MVGRENLDLLVYSYCGGKLLVWSIEQTTLVCAVDDTSLIDHW